MIEIVGFGLVFGMALLALLKALEARRLAEDAVALIARLNMPVPNPNHPPIVVSGGNPVEIER